VKVNYIVACYLGERRTDAVVDTTRYIHSHLKWLKDNQVDVARVSVVLNGRGEEDVIAMMRMLDKHKPYYTELKLFARANQGFSYGAWNSNINANVKKREGFTHYFCVEDDYVPVRKDFLEVFASKLNDVTGYAAQKVFDDVEGGFPRHAAVSNGMLSHEAAQAAYDKHGSVFKAVSSGVSYWEAERDQLNFLANIVDCGYGFTDTSNVAATKFLEKVRHARFRVITIDKHSGPPLLEPIYDVL